MGHQFNIKWVYIFFPLIYNALNIHVFVITLFLRINIFMAVVPSSLYNKMKKKKRKKKKILRLLALTEFWLILTNLKIFEKSLILPYRVWTFLKLFAGPTLNLVYLSLKKFFPNCANRRLKRSFHY